MKPRRIRTVGDLRAYLREESLSPEKLSKRIGLSHMTLRRMLRTDDSTPISAKYHPGFDQLVAPTPSARDLDGLVEDLEREGSRIADPVSLDGDLERKLQDASIGASIRGQVRFVRSAALSPRSSLRTRAVCLGALLYLINPMDLVPDQIPVAGYMDDFAVLALAAGFAASDADRKGGKGRRLKACRPARHC